jgi:hypothetical protein
MQVISNINPELKVILEEFSSWFFNSDYQTELIPHEKLDDNEKGEYATSGKIQKHMVILSTC